MHVGFLFYIAHIAYIFCYYRVPVTSKQMAALYLVGHNTQVANSLVLLPSHLIRQDLRHD